MKTKILMTLVLAMTFLTSCVEQEEMRCGNFDFELETITILPNAAFLKVINKSVSADRNYEFVIDGVSTGVYSGYNNDNSNDKIMVLRGIRKGQNYKVTIYGSWQSKDYNNINYWDEYDGEDIVISYPVPNFSFRTPVDASDAVGVSNLVTVKFTASANNVSSTYAHIGVTYKFNYGYEFWSPSDASLTIYADPELKNKVGSYRDYRLDGGYFIYLNNLSPDTEYYCKSVVVNGSQRIDSPIYSDIELPDGTIIESEEVFSFRTKP